MSNIFATDSTEGVTLAKEAGLNIVRCSLTGQPIGTIDDSMIAAAIDFEFYLDPFQSLDNVIDTLQMRWLIQSSKPAPHLTTHKTESGFHFLRTNRPLDLFAILAGRLVFEHTTLTKADGGSQLLNQKLLWLTEVWDVLSTWTEANKAAMEKTLDSLITLDAIHGIRQCLYSPLVREMAKLIRTSDFDFNTFAQFVAEVQNSGFIYLSKNSAKPSGNMQAIYVVLTTNGILPEELVREEEANQRREATRRRAIESVNAVNSSKAGSVKIRRGASAALSLADIGGTLHPKIAEKYAALIEAKHPKVEKDKDGTPKPTRSKTTSKALARFSDIDIDIEF